MSYAIQYNKTDTLAATLLSGATSTTLTTGNFGTPSGTQLYVVDWDVPAKAEIISASVATTAVTSITRGLTGGAAGTTDHQIGAKIASIFVPQHYANGLGSIAANDAWTAWTPSFTGFSVNPTVTARYIQLGKIVIASCLVTADGTSNSTAFTMTLPIAAKGVNHLTTGLITDNSAGVATPGRLDTAAGSTTATLYKDMSGAAWTNTGLKDANFLIIYEAN